jgi:hypothetical protein
MVRRLGAVLGCFALTVATISVSAPSASTKVGSARVASTQVVSGHDLARVGLTEGWVGCTGSNPPTPQRLMRRGGTLGTHAIGWQPGAGYGAGALAHTAHPASLSSFQGDVYFPSGSGTGYAVAFYYDQTRPGFWFGSRQVPYTGTGFVTANLASSTFTWYQIVNGTAVDGPYVNTVIGFAQGVSGDSGGADLGILMGCEGQPYYFDNLRVADAFDQTVYDFEGVPSASRLGWNIKGKRVKYKNKTVPYGQKLWMLGDSYDPVTLKYIVGQGTIYQQAFESGAVPVGTDSYDTQNYAGVLVKPKRQTTYWFNTPGNDAYDSSDSNSITVRVVADLKASLNSLQLHPGQRAVISGKLLPGNRGTKVTLQQRAGRWQTVDKTRSGRGGRFSVGVTAHKTGQLVLRLKVASGDGNLGFLTIPQKVTVKARSKPHPPNPPSHHIAPEGPAPEPEQHFPPPPPRSLASVKAPGLPASSPPVQPSPADPPTCTTLGPGLPAPCPPVRRG